MPKFSNIFLPYLVNQTQKHKHKPISSKNTNTNPAIDLSCQPNTKTTNTNPNISKNTNTNSELAPPTIGISRSPSHYLSLFTTTNNLQLNRSPVTQKIQNTQKKNKPKKNINYQISRPKNFKTKPKNSTQQQPNSLTSRSK